MDGSKCRLITRLPGVGEAPKWKGREGSSEIFFWKEPFRDTKILFFFSCVWVEVFSPKQVPWQFCNYIWSSFIFLRLSTLIDAAKAHAADLLKVITLRRQASWCVYWDYTGSTTPFNLLFTNSPLKQFFRDISQLLHDFSCCFFYFTKL